jgi:membrane alanyl aminopeptidase
MVSPCLAYLDDRIVINSELVPGANKWMIFNLQQSGYYRVNYDKTNWKYLVDQLHNDHTVIPATNRAQMIDDMFELARKGLVDYDLALEATSYLSKETEHIPLKAASKAFDFLDRRLRRSAIYGKWQV